MKDVFLYGMSTKNAFFTNTPRGFAVMLSDVAVHSFGSLDRESMMTERLPIVQSVFKFRFACPLKQASESEKRILEVINGYVLFFDGHYWFQTEQDAVMARLVL